MRVSAVVPAYNEAGRIAGRLRALRESAGDEVEIVLVDGGSRDGTAGAAKPWADQVEAMAAPNRGAQLHAGARRANGGVLFFVHADAEPPRGWARILSAFWSARGPSPAAASVFRVDYGPAWAYRLVAWGQNARVSLFQVAFGDAGLATTAGIYRRAGGFPEIPLMEDVSFCRRLRALGRIELLDAAIKPSARRLERKGPLRNSLENAWLLTRYKSGADPAALWRSYYGGGT